MSSFFQFLRPHRSVPKTPWTAESRWQLSISRVSILIIGLLLFGFGEALLIVSKLGNSPWTVLAQGISKQLGISVGVATVLISTIVLLMWIPLREKPGFGTIANIIVIASALDFGINFFPTPSHYLSRMFYVVLGVIAVGVGSSLYITCGLGPGPRDGWMTALHNRTGIPVGRVRFSIEALVLIVGWLLGGTVGLGTAIFALTVGYSVALSFAIVDRLVS